MEYKNLLVNTFHLSEDNAHKMVESVKKTIDNAPQELAKKAVEHTTELIMGSIFTCVLTAYYKCTGKKTPEQIAKEEKAKEIQDAIEPRFKDLEKRLLEQSNKVDMILEQIMTNQNKSNDDRASLGKFTAVASGSPRGRTHSI